MLLVHGRGLPPAWKLRLALLAAAGLLAFGVLATRIYRLQVEENPYYERLARHNTLVVERTVAPRGRIYDRQARMVVSTQPAFEMYVIPAEIPRRTATVDRIAAALGADPARMRKKVEERMRTAPLEPLTLQRNLSRQQLARAAALARDLKGVFVGAHGRRRYLYDTAAVHALGYMGEISAEELRSLRREGYSARDMVGKEGLERTYDRMLRGRKGIRHLYVDAQGRTVFEEEERRPIAGLDLHLSMDMATQKVAEAALRQKLDELRTKNGETSSGAVVAMHARTGGLVAMASLPGYDPRPFARGIQPEEYRALLAAPGDPLVDRAAHAAFSPGSIFKPLNSTAALSYGLCHPDTVFVCGGSYKGANCFVTSGHGAITFREAIAQSCDVVFYMLADRMGIDRLNRYLRAFGLGSPTGVDLPGEETGILPSPKWKERWLGEEWYGGDTINMGIGQGFLVVTPMQMAVATAAVANDGYVLKPHLAEYATNHKGEVVWRYDDRALRRVPAKKEHYRAIREGMRAAVTHGTSTAANSEKVTVGGKTGTVESFPSAYNPSGRNHTWFVSFAPVQEPEIVVVVFLEKSGGYGGEHAAPVARKVIDQYFGGRR